jgi:hypothetical protein
MKSITTIAIFIFAAMHLPAQSAPRLDRQTVDRRVSEIVNHALEQGKSVTADGVQVRSMRVDVSLDEEKEIISYGMLAVSPLRKLLDAEEYPAQILSVSLLNQIGGKPALPPLRYAAENCASAAARLRAVLGLGRQSWDEVSDVIRRVATNDKDGLVREAAQKEVAKHY